MLVLLIHLSLKSHSYPFLEPTSIEHKMRVKFLNPGKIGSLW